MDPDALDKLLLSLIDRESKANFDLELTEPVPWEGNTSLNSKEADLLLQEGTHQGLLEGDRREGDGSMSWWSNICLTVDGLRRLGEWPPAGGEHLPGPWDNGVWGERDRSLLDELATSPPHADFLHGPEGGDSAQERDRWRVVLRLLSAGLIAGGLQRGGLDGVRLTVEGRRALDGPTGPLDRAVVELRRGAKAEAMTAVVDEALADLLRKLAAVKGVPTEQNGKPWLLSNLADRLLAAGAFARDSHAEVQMCLALRNETDHGRGVGVSEPRIARAIETARELGDRLLPS